MGKGRFRILQYHSVRDVPQGMKFSFNVTPMAFARQMEYLARNNYNIITFDKLASYKYQGQTLPPKSVIITFDDGYVDNYANAFPILKRHDFKATVFLVTDSIDSGCIFHWLKLDERLRASQQEEKSSWLPLDKQSILDMQAQGMSFGAHTRTHCALDSIEEDKAIDEIASSRKCLEDILSKPVTYFAYPFDKVNEKIKGLVKESGYKIAVGGTGSNTLKSDFFKLKRIEIEKGDSLKKFARKVNGAYDWIEYLFSAKIFITRALSQMRRNER